MKSLLSALTYRKPSMESGMKVFDRSWIYKSNDSHCYLSLCSWFHSDGRWIHYHTVYLKGRLNLQDCVRWGDLSGRWSAFVSLLWSTIYISNDHLPHTLHSFSCLRRLFTYWLLRLNIPPVALLNSQNSEKNARSNTTDALVNSLLTCTDFWKTSQNIWKTRPQCWPEVPELIKTVSFVFCEVITISFYIFSYKQISVCKRYHHCWVK